MNKKVWMIGGLLAFVAYKLQAKSIAAQNLVVKDFVFQGLNWHILSGTVHFKMMIQNIAPASVPFNGFTGVIYYKLKDSQGNLTIVKDLLPVSISGPLTITANNVTAIPVDIDLSLLNIGAKLLDMIKSKQWLKNAFVRGTLVAGAGTIQVKIDKSIIG